MKRVLFKMHLDKALGPDGMTPAFFQKHWSVIGADIVNLVSNFFKDGTISQGLNDTNVVLITKKKSPIKIKELRPISLCNVLVKVITKVAANRLKEVLEDIISETQSAFIPGRLISDNMMVSFEVMHYLRRKRRGNEGFMTIKLDMSKAYDRVEWAYLRAIMRKMRFSDRWIHLVIICVSSVSYKIVHGVYETCTIVPSCGIRQGDPLSPYLFIICAEGLSALIRNYESHRWIQGIQVCRRAPRLLHMFFADDSYLFCRASNKILELLHNFECASGQQLNSMKSSIFSARIHWLIIERKRVILSKWLKQTITACTWVYQIGWGETSQ